MNDQSTKHVTLMSFLRMSNCIQCNRNEINTILQIRVNTAVAHMKPIEHQSKTWSNSHSHTHPSKRTFPKSKKEKGKTSLKETIILKNVKSHGKLDRTSHFLLSFLSFDCIINFTHSTSSDSYGVHFKV